MSVDRMFGLSDKVRHRWPYGWVALVAITHRAMLFATYRADLRALAEANPKWLTVQLLRPEMLATNATAALFYLQQTPPVPNLVMVLVAKWLPGPVETANALILLQTAISAMTALVLVRVILLLFPTRSVLAAAIGTVFILNTDLVVLEYNSFGQTFYENLSMLFALASVALLIVYRRTRGRAVVVELGVMVALLALTRASWSFFAVPVAAMVAVLSRVGRARAVALFLIPVALLHGGWCVKNWLVFGNLSPATSTWTGWNLTNGLVHAGFGKDLREFVATHRTTDGTALQCIMASDVGWLSFPADTDADHDIDAHLGFAQSHQNTNGWRLASDSCQEAVLSFCWAMPGVCGRKMGRAYQLFWQPMANYGRFFLDLFAVGNTLKNGFDVAGVARLMAAGALPDKQYVVSGTLAHKHFVTAQLYTLRWLDPVILVANIIALHVLVPVLLIWWYLRRPVDEETAQRRAALLMALTVYAYLAFVASVAEYGENMRFRLDVEPVIWLITLISFAELFGRIVPRVWSVSSGKLHRPAGEVQGRAR